MRKRKKVSRKIPTYLPWEVMIEDLTTTINRQSVYFDPLLIISTKPKNKKMKKFAAECSISRRKYNVPTMSLLAVLK